jgi:ABC-type nickel/cobalt efflux system permease component RcnA
VLVIGPRLIAAALEEKNFIRLLLVTGGILSTIVITDLSVLVCVRASVREREYAQTHTQAHMHSTHTHTTHTHTHTS